MVADATANPRIQALRHVYGPIPSRRLGRSLGVDPVRLKTCNWNCVYCQLGRTHPLCKDRREYVPAAKIATELRRALDEAGPGSIDWITFVGSGEPTLNTALGAMIRHARRISSLPIAVITNGSLFFLREVRAAVAAAEAVLPSLDAGSAELYRRINRPHPGVPFDRFVRGLVDFRQEYRGRLWLEIMLLRGINDTEAALADLAHCCESIQPDAIHLNLPVRPPSETWVHPSDEAGLARARHILGERARVVMPFEGRYGLAGTGRPTAEGPGPRVGETGRSPREERAESEDTARTRAVVDSVVDAIVGILERHPMREEELTRTLGEWPAPVVAAALLELETSGRAKRVERLGARFWAAAASDYPSRARSDAADPRRHSDGPA